MTASRPLHLAHDAPRPRRGIACPLGRCRLLCGACLALSVGCAGQDAGPPAGDVQFSQACSAAAIAFDRGEPDVAAQLYERALRRGRAMDDGPSVAAAAYSLAACEAALGRYDPAWAHLAEARYDGPRDGATADEVWLLTAKVAYLREQDDQARRLVGPVVASSAPLVRLQAQALLVLIACDLRDPGEARARLAAARTTAAALPGLPPSVSAEVEKAEGAVAQLDGDPRGAAGHFDREASLLRAAHRYRDAVHALARSAAAHEAAGEVAPAADRYYRAARAAAALGDRPRAGELAGRALALARAARDADLADLVEGLVTEVRAPTDP